MPRADQVQSLRFQDTSLPLAAKAASA